MAKKRVKNVSSRIYDSSEYEHQRRVNDIFKSSVYALNSFEQSVSTTAPASTQLMFSSSLDVHLIEYRARVIDADLGLMGSDLRASERTYQLLSQVSGRAGRGAKKGRVYLQTLYPENAVLNALVAGNSSDFYQIEKQTRKILKMPPFGKLAAIIVSGMRKEETERWSLWLSALPLPSAYPFRA